MTFSTASGLSVKRLLTRELFPDRKWKSKIRRSEATTQGRDSGGRLAPRSLPWRRGCTPGAHAACPCSATRSPSVLPPPCQHPLVSLVSPSRPPAGGTCSHWHRAERPHVLQPAAPFPNAGTWDQALALPGPSCPLPDRPLQDRPVPSRTAPSPPGPLCSQPNHPNAPEGRGLLWPLTTCPLLRSNAGPGAAFQKRAGTQVPRVISGFAPPRRLPLR